ncbi:hypothetical protein KSP40_PGU017967 [Platanthera guangdongensis]|uniref:Uncharacterized protein n=1 Tax=Platanthera guangdongensis TaxID=2320717 RepID=A0ABR2LTK2_9ASPA
MSEFLLLTVALDKLYFTPLGKFMDERDASIRAQLGDAKDMAGEVKQLEEQAAAVLKAARAEVSAALNQMRRETTAELEASFAEEKKKVEEELVKALAALENQKEETLKFPDSQIDLLSSEIVSKVLPSAPLINLQLSLPLIHKHFCENQWELQQNLIDAVFCNYYFDFWSSIC